MTPDVPLHRSSPSELKARIEAERAGAAFLIYRDDTATQRIAALRAGPPAMTLGRAPSCHIAVPWDGEASRVHAELEVVGDRWTVSDDGLSRNGTFVNGDRVSGRRRLEDGDELRVGSTTLVYRCPQHAGSGTVTRTAGPQQQAAAVTEAQRRVLVALCRPCAGHVGFAAPASNQVIADQLHLTVAAVKTHLRALFHRFEIDQLPQNEKRRRLVQLAFHSGLVTEHDLA
jgi:hypothetical protein